LLVSLSNRKAGFDQLSAQISSQMVALVYNRPYPFSKYFFQEFVDQINARGKKRFLLYPRFVMAIVRHFCPNLVYDQGSYFRPHVLPARLFADLQANTGNLEGLNDPPLFGHLVNPRYRSLLDNDIFVDDVADDESSTSVSDSGSGDDDSNNSSDDGDDDNDSEEAASHIVEETESDETTESDSVDHERRTKRIHDINAPSSSDTTYHFSRDDVSVPLQRERRSKACHSIPAVSDSAHSIHAPEVYILKI